MRICTDSSAQLPASLVAALGVDVVPVSIALDDRAADETDLDVDAFYAALADGVRATTSQPTPGRFAEAYAAAHARGDREVLSIHVDSRISGTVGSAGLAAHEARLPVAVVDTGTASFGVAICVLAAAETVAGGGSRREAVDAIEQVAPAIGNVFAAADAPGGRIPVAPGIPLLSLVGGQTETLAPAGSLDEAAELMVAHVLRQPGALRVAVGHAAGATEAAADRLADALKWSGAVVDVLRYRVGPSIGAHTGSLSFGAFWWPAPA